MHPEQIKAELRMRGVTQIILAERLGVGKSSVAMVIAGTCVSANVRAAIAKIIGKSITEIWPTPAHRLRRTRAEIEAVRGVVA